MKMYTSVKHPVLLFTQDHRTHRATNRGELFLVVCPCPEFHEEAMVLKVLCQDGVFYAFEYDVEDSCEEVKL